jgi:hypothetical protein
MSELELPNRVLGILLACERGLLRAYESASGDPFGAGHILARGSELHREHVRWLSAAMDKPLEREDTIDGAWVHKSAFLLSEMVSHATWHDALSDLSPEVARYAVERLLPEHHELLRAWEAIADSTVESSVTE